MKIRQIIKSILPKKFVYKYLTLCRKSYGQAGQDFWVYGEVFDKKKNGFFVEIGSNDGITYNNTFLLETKFKWSGLCVEANPIVFENLIKNRKVECINACVSDSNGLAFFYNDGLDSGIIFESEQISLASADNSENIFELNTYTLDSIFKKHKVPSIIDYMSMDIEGAEWLALKNFPFNDYQFRCITIERPNVELRTLLEVEGYVVIKEIPGLDVFFIHKSFINTYQMNLMNFWEVSKSKKISV